MNKIRYQQFKQRQQQKTADSPCENCGKDHDHSYGTGRFCSKSCMASYIAKHVKKRAVPHKGAAPKKNWKCHRCGLIFDTRAQKQAHSKECRNGQAWNKGLTKETSEAVYRAAVSYSANNKGKPGHLHTKETREKLSLARSRRIDEDRSGFLHVKWYKVKNLNGDEYIVRGHWEENVALKLNSLGILWTKNKWIEYSDSDGVCHRYNPDFYIPAHSIYVEVKGYYSEKDKRKMKYVVEQNKNIRIYFIGAKQYKPFIDGKIRFDNNLKLVV